MSDFFPAGSDRAARRHGTGHPDRPGPGPQHQGRVAPWWTTRVVPGGQVTRLGRGTSRAVRLAPAAGPEAATAKAPVANRSLSSRARATRTGPGLSGIPASNTPVAGAPGATSFSGINHHQQRFEVAGGNQWSLEPPDQALCVGGGYVFEAVNNAVAVYDDGGARQALDSPEPLLQLPGRDRPHYRGRGTEADHRPDLPLRPDDEPLLPDDPHLRRRRRRQPAAGGHNTLDTAVSPTGDPLGTWTITHIDATDDGSDGTPSHPGCPCIGDYPHIGVDANGYYITTNEYPWFTDGFVGPRSTRCRRPQLASGAASVTVTQFDTSRAAPGGQPGFTVWPAQSPTTAQYATAAGRHRVLPEHERRRGGERHRPVEPAADLVADEHRIAGDRSTPALGVHVSSPRRSATYAIPLAGRAEGRPGTARRLPEPHLLRQAGVGHAGQVQGARGPDRLRSTPACSRSPTLRPALRQPRDRRRRRLVGPDAAQRAGIAWYVTQPTTAANGNLSTSVLQQGRIASAGNNLLIRRSASALTAPR